MLEIVPFQEEFRQGLPNVTGNVDYEQFRDNLERIAELIKLSKIEQKVMLDALRQHQEDYDRRRQARGKKDKGVKSQGKGADTEDGAASPAVRDSAAFDGGSLPGVQLQIG